MTDSSPLPTGRQVQSMEICQLLSLLLDGGGLSPEPCEIQGIALHPTWCRGEGGRGSFPTHPRPLPPGERE